MDTESSISEYSGTVTITDCDGRTADLTRIRPGESAQDAADRLADRLGYGRVTLPTTDPDWNGSVVWGDGDVCVALESLKNL